jgi:hypothetical protein
MNEELEMYATFWVKKKSTEINHLKYPGVDIRQADHKS